MLVARHAALQRVRVVLGKARSAAAPGATSSYPSLGELLMAARPLRMPWEPPSQGLRDLSPGAIGTALQASLHLNV